MDVIFFIKIIYFIFGTVQKIGIDKNMSIPIIQ